MSPPARRPRHRRDLAPASDLLARAIRGSTAAGDLEGLRRAWPGIVGPAATRFSLPLRRSRAGVLTVACADATWAHELAAQQGRLLFLVGRECPDTPVASLRFVIADHALPPPPPEPAPPPGPPAPTAVAAAEGMVAGVEDPELRALLVRLLAREIDRAGSRAPVHSGDTFGGS